MRPVLKMLMRGALLMLIAVSAAAAYPDHPIRFVVPVAAGGGNDIVARLLAQKLTDAWGQSVVVDNRPGAATAIGAEIVARAIPDGYTIMLTSVSFAINAGMRKQLPFDPVRDFATITQVARVPQIMVVNPAVPAATLAEFIALAKAMPGQLNYASAGTGSSTHLAMELFMDMTGTKLNHVPYKGTAPGLTDVIAGHVQITFDAIPPTLPHVKSNRVRALAIGGTQRFPTLPDVPTLAEAGLPNYTFQSWFGIFAPARTPEAVVRTLNRELVRIIALPETRKAFVELGIEPVGTSPEDFGKYLRAEIARWSDVMRAHNIRGE
ncbi:MAG TPA: tripartite tricarboxylate transporter substrate binding protein [Burkholderiales bacterium]|nr:tripartite tricarboxylate transporter substrate binding protein [Burkholderiales bacterium]